MMLIVKVKHLLSFLLGFGYSCAWWTALVFKPTMNEPGFGVFILLLVSTIVFLVVFLTQLADHWSDDGSS